MTSCEMCGKDEKLFPALIEGVELNVCQNCASFGKILKKPLILRKKEIPVQKPVQLIEKIQMIREDYSSIIRNKREKMGLKQEEFAKFLSEKESIIHKIESGSYIPSLEMARKIEKQLGVILIEEKEVEPQHLKEKKEIYTIGDILKIK